MKLREKVKAYGAGSSITLHCLCCLSSSRGVTSERGASACCLDAAESLQLLRPDGHLLTKPNLACCATNEGHTIPVKALIDRRHARLSANDGDTFRSLLRESLDVTFTEVLDDRGLHPELNKVEGKEPYNVLHKRVSLTSGQQRLLRTQTQTIPIQPPEIL